MLYCIGFGAHWIKGAHKGHTNRGHSGALYLQPATAGANSRIEGYFRIVSAADLRVEI